MTQSSGVILITSESGSAHGWRAIADENIEFRGN